MKHKLQTNLLHIEIENFIREQSEIMSAFRLEHPDLRDWDHLMDWPRQGQLLVGPIKWTFNRHGLGIRFVGQDSGTVVDIHRNVQDVSHFDDWRILLYLQSRGFDIDPTKLRVNLEKLVSAGSITHVGNEMFAIQK